MADGRCRGRAITHRGHVAPKLRTALGNGQIIRDSRGRYALPTAPQALRAANRLNGIVSHASAVAYHGWKMKNPPTLPSSGRTECFRVLKAADGRADNPFELVLRAIALGVPGLEFVPQLVIRENGFGGEPGSRRSRPAGGWSCGSATST